MLVVTAMLIAGVAAVVAMVRHRGRAGRPVVTGMLLGGWGIAGNGWVGGLLADLAARLALWVGDATATAVGASVPGLVLAVVAAVVAIDYLDRRIWAPTPWLALVLPTVAAVVGGMYTGYDGVLGTVGMWLVWLVDLPTSLGW